MFLYIWIIFRYILYRGTDLDLLAFQYKNDTMSV